MLTPLIHVYTQNTDKPMFHIWASIEKYRYASVRHGHGAGESIFCFLLWEYSDCQYGGWESLEQQRL
jgi:hypothetical protein